MKTKYTTAQMKRLKDKRGLWQTLYDDGQVDCTVFIHGGDYAATSFLGGERFNTDHLMIGRVADIETKFATDERLTWRRVWRQP